MKPGQLWMKTEKPSEKPTAFLTGSIPPGDLVLIQKIPHFGLAKAYWCEGKTEITIPLTEPDSCGNRFPYDMKLFSDCHSYEEDS